ncbi:GPN-loop GTPase [Parastagonospora nodorum]|nr:GPN-loop GTPase [Parastagonospora nodorum]KAH4002199.1 GPN-loop GTPase [Parastagonospora nodorum]KAH4031815.1 GPN-loop GTPase [Parastagonospora nodorum]KAH4108637.1 GPN-loop GTPase [Parastagonospora nodorum]KAH4294401.1 GPN-loop GTPase [Parastagonospora nodorum]
MSTSKAPEASAPTPDKAELPVAIVCVGMAGSGKTTFMQRLVSHIYTHPDPAQSEPSVSKTASPTPPYIINLDPAVHHVPFTPNIDIRDSVNYKEVMKQFNLGPNGGILTSLNLFSTKIDQVIGLLEKRTQPPPPVKETEQTTVEFMTNSGKEKAAAPAQQQQVKHILVDTPGQIEVFVWSASGEILLSSLASTFPTVIAYIIDTPRTTSTSTFMSNMLYACSILYKTKLPMVLVFNKTDAQDAEFAKKWMTDFEAFQTALRDEEEGGTFGGDGVGGGSGYMGSLLNSMSLVLEEFYKHLSVVGVSAMTGDGVDDFFRSIAAKKEEFQRDYQPELERRRAEREQEKQKSRQRELDKLMKDMKVGGAGTKPKPKSRPNKEEPETVSDAEDQDSDDSMEYRAHEDDEDSDNPDGSLEDRYQQALKNAGAGQDDDMSFARYMQAAKFG